MLVQERDTLLWLRTKVGQKSKSFVLSNSICRIVLIQNILKKEQNSLIQTVSECLTMRNSYLSVTFRKSITGF